MDWEGLGMILVVGTETECKTRVADALAEGSSATEVEISKCGVRTFRRKRSRKPVVIDTTPFETYAGWSILDVSRAWIATNSLKKLVGQHVFVVCVATSSGPHDNIFEEPDFVQNKFSWLNQLAFIFKKHQRHIMVLVKLQGTHDSGATKSGMKGILERDGYATSNVMFITLRGVDLYPPVRIALQQSGHRCRREGEPNMTTQLMVPFRLEAVTKDCSDVERLGPWGPERVILLGRTGGGKSTLAQMLTLGKLDPFAQRFAASSSIRGKTSEVSHGEGRGWYVVDTPGFGEPDDEHKTVSTEEAETKIKKYVQLIEGTYTHFILVVKKDRIDWMEERLWEFFLQLFGEDIIENFTVVISNADQDWVDRNWDALRASFRGCESFLGAEFPSTRIDDEEWEAELVGVRRASLKALEEGLCVLYRSTTFSDVGQYSKMNIKRERAGLDLATRDTKSWRKKAAISLSAGLMEIYGDFRRLALILRRDDKIVLDLSL